MSEFNPHDPDARRTLLSHHPLITNEFTTFTPSIPKVAGEVLDAVMLHKKSICFNALPQMGKTKICNSCIVALEEHPDYQDRLIIKISADPNSHESVMRTLVRSLGLAMPKIFNLDFVREDVLNMIEGRLTLIKGRHAVFFIDEMQRLTTDDYECLQFLQNELAIRNIGVTVIGFAQADIEKCVTNLRTRGRPELIIRFLNELVKLPLCDSEAWIRETLEYYDDSLFYPVDSECSYTRFFMPMAFDAGFRLANYSRPIFQALDEAKTAKKLPCLPTVCVLEMVRFILIRSRSNDSPEFVIDSRVLAGAINECQIENYAASFNKPSAGRDNK